MKDVALIRDPLFLRHVAPEGHPERAERLRAIESAIEEDPILRALPRFATRPAESDELLRVHAAPMIEEILAASGRSGWFDADTYFSADSAQAARVAAGSTAALAQAIWTGAVRRGFSLVRPPGHHATAERAMGFCLFNHVAVAAAAVKALAPRARIAIVDFDLHHGNGTQELFYEDPDVLFVSSHRYPYYPGTGAADERGRGAGRDTTINFPLARAHDDSFFFPLYARLALPIVDAFAPDIILVSAGYDGHVDDPMQGFRSSTAYYGWLTESLLALAEKRSGKILFCLEGGYNPQALAESVAASLRAIVAAPRASFTPAAVAAEGDHAELETFRKFFRGVVA